MMLQQATAVELAQLLPRIGLLFPKSTAPDMMLSHCGCRGPGVDCTTKLWLPGEAV